MLLLFNVMADTALQAANSLVSFWFYIRIKHLAAILLLISLLLLWTGLKTSTQKQALNQLHPTFQTCCELNSDFFHNLHPEGVGLMPLCTVSHCSSCESLPGTKASTDRWFILLAVYPDTYHMGQKPEIYKCKIKKYIYTLQKQQQKNYRANY